MEQFTQGWDRFSVTSALWIRPLWDTWTPREHLGFEDWRGKGMTCRKSCWCGLLGAPSASHQKSPAPHSAGLCPALCPFAAKKEQGSRRASAHGWRLSMALLCPSVAVPTEGCELPRPQPVMLGWGFHILGAPQLLPAHLWDCTTSASLYNSTTYL